MVHYLAIAGQLALVVFLVRELELVGDGFGDLVVVALAGFVIHALAPAQHRMLTFLGASLVGIVVVLGPLAAAWLVGLGTALIAICRLTPTFALRVALLVLLGAVLAALRLDPARAPWPAVVWVPLASMFMFRLIVYLRDRRHATEPSPWLRDLAYFFMLPNVCFPLFPVVDYETWAVNYYRREPERIYQQGVDWILRGLLHLLLYRVVYQRLALASGEVATAAELVQFLIANILLFLRISGHFHLIVGLLKLFGFDLPETNRLYFLAGGFGDYWRRINIYWMSFMTRLVYLPLLQWVRPLGNLPAVAVPVLAVFVVSWLLHSYQWFWLQGAFPLRWVDAFFWGSVGLLVMAASLVEVRGGRRRVRTRGRWTPLSFARRALQTLATFSVITVLWSLWTSESINDWLALWRRVEWRWEPRPEAAWLLVLPVLGLAGLWLREGGSRIRTESGSFARRALPTSTSLVTLVALFAAHDAGAVRGDIGRMAAAVRESSLSAQDARLLERGYYERILLTPRLDSPLVELYAADAHRPQGLPKAKVFRQRDDLLGFEVRPRQSGLYLKQPFSSNRWGMRDREYSLAKPPGVYRIALLGSSHTMGHGVANDEIFEALVEERIAREGLNGIDGRVEILNFAVDDYSVLQQVILLEEKVFRFQPDVVMYVAHASELQWTRTHLIKALKRDLSIPYEFARTAVRLARIEEGRQVPTFEREPQTHLWSVLEGCYRRIVEACRRRGVAPVWIFMPRPREFGQQEMITPLVERAETAGFRVANMAGIFRGYPHDWLRISARNLHPGPNGHRVIAEKLFELLTTNPELLRKP